MNVVVCGGSGFLGSHVADALSDQGYKVTIFDLKPSPYLQPDQKMMTGDMLDARTVTRALKDADYVYHFAGFADLNEATLKPLETIRQNILGTAMVLEAAVQMKVKRFIYASSIYVYSNLGGFYRCSKQAGELYVEEYQRRHNLPYTILRYGTLYGPRADQSNSVYRFLAQALTQGKIQFPGTGDEIREYIHVRDAAKLSVQVLDEEFENRPVIVTGHYPMKAKEILNMIREILNNKVKIELDTSGAHAHYHLTPYSFIPKVGKKLVSNCYEDMGQGLLECLNLMHQEGKDTHI